MEETVETPVKKARGWPKGKPRKPVQSDVIPLPVPMEAPIHIRLRIKNYSEAIEFGCARRLIENGFHVFFYPSKRDPYRETRREFAISEVIEIEITEARQVYQTQPEIHPTYIASAPATNVAPTQPVVHNAKEYALARMKEKAEQESASRVDKIPGITFGDSLA